VPETESAAGDQFLPLLEIFIDPASAGRRIERRAPWLWPTLIIGIGTLIIGVLMVPLAIRIAQTSLPPNVPREVFEQRMPMIEKLYYGSALATPLFIAIKLLALAGLLKLVTMMGDMQLGFKKLFSLVAHCNLILFLEGIAVFIVVRAKGDEVQTAEDLMPALGLDLLVRGEVGKSLLGALHFFTVFEFWFIAALVVAFAALAKCSRWKAFCMTLPLWVLGLIASVLISLVRR
jgi:hypothetical protein